MHVWCTPLLQISQKQQPCLTPWVLQSATGVRSATFSVLIFSKGQHLWMLIKFEQLVLVHLSWPENKWGKTDMMFRINATDGKHWGKTEYSTGEACVKIADQLIAVESLSVNIYAHKYEIAFLQIFPHGCSNWSVLLKLTLCGLVQNSSTGREGWDREKIKAAFR